MIAGVLAVSLMLPLVFKQRSTASDNFVAAVPIPGEAREVFFQNPTDQTSLSGLIYEASGNDPSPLAVIIHGSGSSRRDNGWYLSLVRSLRDAGISVLLPDKRGCEKSEGDWIGVDLETLATDAEAAIRFVRNQPDREQVPVGIIGISQGGWIAPIVASHVPDLAFVVDLSGTTATLEEQLAFEEFHNIAPYTYDMVASALAPITAERVKRLDTVAALAGFDPVPWWNQTTAPVFFAYGENDTMCPVKLSVQRIQEQQLRHELLKVYPSGGHGILDESGQHISQTFLGDLTQFIKESCAELLPLSQASFTAGGVK